MKKLFCILLAIALLLSVTACSEKPAEDTTVSVPSLSVGYASADISPTESLPLDGYSGTGTWDPEKRWSKSVEWPLLAISIAITDAKDQTVLIVALDMLTAFMADAMRSAINADTGIPKENIYFHCTHNHNGVALRVQEPVVTNYIAQLTNSVVISARDALRDRKPVKEVSTTFTRAEDCNTVRHYLVTDGEYLTANNAVLFGDTTWYGHTTIADDLLQMVKFSRDGGKDVVMINYQGHLCASGMPMSTATSDYAGVLRNYVETQLNCQSIFIQGGGGNLVMSTKLEDEVMRATGQDYQHLGQTLGADAVAAAANFAPIDIDNIRHKEQMVLLDTKDGGKMKAYLSAFAIGDFALVAAPFEIFDTNAMYVRENSPYKMTFYSSCTNGANQYLSTPELYDWRVKYEVGGSPGGKGAAEAVQNHLLDMLNEFFCASGRTQTEKPAGYVREPFVPESDGKTYTIVKNADGSVMTKVKNNFLQFKVIREDGKQKYMLVKDEALANTIAGMETAQFIFDHQNVVVDIVK
jgi:hypothetical protein